MKPDFQMSFLYKLLIQNIIISGTLEMLFYVIALIFVIKIT